MVPAIVGAVMNKKQLPLRFIGLRGKLLLATALIIILPVAGLNYLKELEVFLKENHARSVTVLAHTIAAVFKDNASLISLNQRTQSPNQAIYCHNTLTAKVIDGYDDDWFSFNTQSAMQLESSSSNKAVSLLCANDDDYYYFLISVKAAIQPLENSFGTTQFIPRQEQDLIIFKALDYNHTIQTYQFQLLASGTVFGQLHNSDQSHKTQGLSGRWQANKEAYTVEFKIPLEAINHYMDFNVQTNNILHENQPKPPLKATTASFLHQLHPIILTDPLSSFHLKQIIPPSTQLWLLNKDHYISAQADNKTSASISTGLIDNNQPDKRFSIIALYRQWYLFIMSYPEQHSFYSQNQQIIDTPEVQATLQGKTSIQWLDNPYSNQMLLSVSVPVYNLDNKIIGSLVLEQSNKTLLALKDSTFEQIISLSLVIFVTIALSLFFFSRRLLKRIINLRDDTRQAPSKDGKIINQLYRKDNDEIGDLARSFSSLLSRIEENKQFQLSLPSNLPQE